jgi:hypothetical protein
MTAPYDDKFIHGALAGSCPHCGRTLEDGAAVLDEPMFDAHSPAGQFLRLLRRTAIGEHVDRPVLPDARRVPEHSD